MVDENSDIFSFLSGKVDKESMIEFKKRVSFLSHELKRPLSSAILSTYTLKDGYAGKLSDSQKEILDAVVSDLERMTQTIKDLLDKPREKF